MNNPYKKAALPPFFSDRLQRNCECNFQAYKKCPVFESQSFIIRLVTEDDAEDLLICYSDPKSQELFNIDNFPNDCNFYTTAEMLKCIKFWLMEYSQEAYIRFCIVDKATNKAIGTIEMFGMVGKYKTDPGLLRVDIASDYEYTAYLKEIFNVCVDYFYDLFRVNTIATKAIPKAANRLEVLSEIGFYSGDFNGRTDYFLRSKSFSL